MVEGLLWVVVVVLALAQVVFVLIWRRHSAAGLAQADAERAATEERVQALEVSHEDALSRLREEHDEDFARAETQREQALEEASQARHRLALSLGTEKVSERMIAQACAEVGLSGELVTNVVFVPTDPWSKGSYIAQVDHVLLARQTVMLIENKYWQGIVFDGITPSSVLSSFGGMFDEDSLVEPFALQIAPTSSSTWTIREHRDQKSPATQVRRQAQRLSAHLKSEVGSVPWLETAVLYSHAGATVYAASANRSPNGSPTRIMGGYDALVAVLTEVAGRAPTTLTKARLDELRAHFVALGAHVKAVGSAAESGAPTGQTS